MRSFALRFLLAVLGGSLALGCSDGTSPSPTDAMRPAFKVGGRSGFGFNGSVNGFGTGEVRLTGGGSFDPGTADNTVPTPTSVASAGGFDCTRAVGQGPLLGCADGEGVRWDTVQLLESNTFRCTTSEVARPATTDGHTAVLLADWAALLVNYRGYGLSLGQPSETMLCRDALALYDRATRRPDIDSGRVIVIGRSLGTGVATYLASQRPVAGVVLISPYDSLVQVAREAYSFLPVNLLLRHRFDSAARAPSIRAPLLALVAARDEVIRPERSRQLVQAWGGPARFEVLGGVDHNTIHSHSDYWRLIVAFLAERAIAPAQ